MRKWILPFLFVQIISMLFVVGAGIARADMVWDRVGDDPYRGTFDQAVLGFDLPVEVKNAVVLAYHHGRFEQVWVQPGELVFTQMTFGSGTRWNVWNRWARTRQPQLVSVVTVDHAGQLFKVYHFQACNNVAWRVVAKIVQRVSVPSPPQVIEKIIEKPVERVVTKTIEVPQPVPYYMDRYMVGPVVFGGNSPPAAQRYEERRGFEWQALLWPLAAWLGRARTNIVATGGAGGAGYGAAAAAASSSAATSSTSATPTSAVGSHGETSGSSGSASP